MRDKLKKNKANNNYYHRNKERILAKMREEYALRTEEETKERQDKDRAYRENNKETIKERKAREKEKNKIRYSLYWRWKNMMIRCNKPDHHDYENYGARGIKVIAPLDSFKEYKKYILSLVERPEDIFGNHIDRINNDGNYEIGNLRVISVKDNLENSRNPRNNPNLKTKKEGDL